MSKKYQEFKIKITYLNGDSEEINYNKQDKSKYRDMLELYKQTKEKFKDECVIIDFLGVEGDGELGILFQKKITNDKEFKEKKEADAVSQMSVEDIFAKMELMVNILDSKVKKSNEQLAISNKKQDVLLHKIEHFNDIQVSDSEKLNVVNLLQDIRIQRRDLKNEVKVISKFNENDSLRIIKDSLMKARISEENIQAHEETLGVLTNEIIAEKMMKEVSYRSFKERIRLMKQLQTKYNKVYFDDSTMVITCYNKAKRY